MVALFAQQSNIIDFPQPQTNNEWYTPHRYIEAARTVMGSIDLDPASCEVANEIVRAKHYYIQEEDGLKQVWSGNIWLNPPYGKINNKSTIELWIKRLIREYETGNVTSAILLTTCDSDNQWFQLLWNYLICFTNHNVHFFKPINGEIRKDSRSTQMFGTVFTYLGNNEEKFIEVFSQFGTVARRVSTPKQEVRNLSLWEVS